jgi:hypothetical protein
MLFGVVLPRTERFESELNINSKGRTDMDSIISTKDCEKVKFYGFIEGKGIEDCRNKLIKLNKKNNTRLRLYGIPFTRSGNPIGLYKRID